MWVHVSTKAKGDEQKQTGEEQFSSYIVKSVARNSGWILFLKRELFENWQGHPEWCPLF